MPHRIWIVALGMMHACHGKEPTTGTPTTIIHAQSPPPAAEGAERWNVVVDIPMQKTELLVDFLPAESGWTGTLGVPAQNVYGVPLTDITYTDTAVNFTLDKPTMPAANEHYTTARDPAGGTTSTGTMTIHGQSFPVEMQRLEADAPYTPALQRPQTPTPPFPYTTREATYTSGDIQRAGILTLPAGEGPHPSVIIESGSGPQNRDGALAGHKLFVVLADHLARNGIATLRVDDRGVGDSTGSGRDATYTDLTADLLAGVAWLQDQPEINAAQIGVIGHSQGGTIGPMAASQSQSVAFVIMLCGMGVNGDQVMYTQKRLILESMGVEDPWLEERMVMQRQLLDLVLSNADESTIRAFLEANIMVDIAEEDRAQVTPELQEQLVEMGAQQMTAAPIHSLIHSKPADYLPAVTVPVLAVFGQRDLQVEPIENEAAVSSLLADNPAVTTWVVPDMSHNLQETTTGRIEEYGELEETIRPILLDRLVTWIQEQTKE